MDEEFRLWYIWPRRPRSAGSLPPGQGVIKGFPRFGDAFLGEPLPTIPAEPVLTIRGAVDTEHTIPLTELDKLPRQEMVSDFHCVTTWTKQGLRWGGVRFRAVDRAPAEQAGPKGTSTSTGRARGTPRNHPRLPAPLALPPRHPLGGLRLSPRSPP